MEIYYHRRLAGLSQIEAAHFCGYSLRTYIRHERAATPPTATLKLLKYRAGIIEGWPGFRITPGKLWTPAGEDIAISQIDQYYYTLNLLRDTIRDLERRVPSRALCYWLKSVA
jgi:hypothetical protein